MQFLSADLMYILKDIPVLIQFNKQHNSKSTQGLMTSYSRIDISSRMSPTVAYIPAILIFGGVWFADLPNSYNKALLIRSTDKGHE